MLVNRGIRLVGFLLWLEVLQVAHIYNIVNSWNSVTFEAVISVLLYILDITNNYLSCNNIWLAFGGLAGWLQLRKMLELLVHASQCGLGTCQYPKCRSVKGLFRHGMNCRIRASGGCNMCKRMWYLLQLHARACKESECRVPRCKYVAALVYFEKYSCSTRLLVKFYD